MELVFPLASGMTLADDRGEAEARLIAASLGGDQAAFAALVRRHQSRVFLLAGRFFRHREDVEDVSQETFFTAWRKLRTYEARAPFEHWITRVCLRLCYSRLRPIAAAKAHFRRPIPRPRSTTRRRGSTSSGSWPGSAPPIDSCCCCSTAKAGA